MKKFFAVLLWIGLAVCVIMLVSLAGEKAALREENRKAQQKYDALKTVYDREKAEWKSAAEDMSADNTALTLENAFDPALTPDVLRLIASTGKLFAARAGV